MEIVDVKDAVGLKDMAPHLSNIHILRCALEQDVDRVPKELPCPRDDKQPNECGCNRVCSE